MSEQTLKLSQLPILNELAGTEFIPIVADGKNRLVRPGALATGITADALAGKADAVHAHPAYEEALAGKADSEHTHQVEHVTGLQEALNTIEQSVLSKADQSHTHTLAQVEGLEAALDSLTQQIESLQAGGPEVTTVTISQVVDLQNTLDTINAQIAQVIQTQQTGIQIQDVTGLATSLDSLSQQIQSIQAGAATTISEVSGLQDALDAKADVTSVQGFTQSLTTLSESVQTLQDLIAAQENTIAQKADAVHTHQDLVDAIADKADASHIHQDLVDAIATKADTSHMHDISGVTSLQDALDAKASTTHSHDISEVNGLQDALNDKAQADHIHQDLIDGLASKSDSEHTHQDLVDALATKADTTQLMTPESLKAMIREIYSPTLTMDEPVEGDYTSEVTNTRVSVGTTGFYSMDFVQMDFEMRTYTPPDEGLGETEGTWSDWTVAGTADFTAPDLVYFFQYPTVRGEEYQMQVRLHSILDTDLDVTSNVINANPPPLV